jgi:hypothetical protein
MPRGLFVRQSSQVAEDQWFPVALGEPVQLIEQTERFNVGPYRQLRAHSRTPLDFGTVLGIPLCPERNPARNTVQPMAKRTRPADRGGLAKEHHECPLERIVDVVRIAEQLASHPPD